MGRGGRGAAYASPGIAGGPGGCGSGGLIGGAGPALSPLTRQDTLIQNLATTCRQTFSTVLKVLCHQRLAPVSLRMTAGRKKAMVKM